MSHYLQARLSARPFDDFGGSGRQTGRVRGQRREVQLLGQLLLEIVVPGGHCALFHRHLRVFLFSRLVVPKVHLRGSDQSGAHEHGKRGETNGVVLLAVLRPVTRMVRERGRMVQRYAHEEHGQAPAQGTEHSLVTVFVGVRAQQRDDRGVGQSDGGSAEELAYHDQEQQQEEHFLDVLKTLRDTT